MARTAGLAKAPNPSLSMVTLSSAMCYLHASLVENFLRKPEVQHLFKTLGQKDDFDDKVATGLFKQIQAVDPKISTVRIRSLEVSIPFKLFLNYI